VKECPQVHLTLGLRSSMELIQRDEELYRKRPVATTPFRTSTRSQTRPLAPICYTPPASPPV